MSLKGPLNPNTHCVGTWGDAADVVTKWEPLEADCCLYEIWKKSFFKCLTHSLDNLFNLLHWTENFNCQEVLPQLFPFPWVQIQMQLLQCPLFLAQRDFLLCDKKETPMSVYKKYLINRKHVPCFYQVIKRRVEVWENKKCCGNRNTNRLRQVFPQLFLSSPKLSRVFLWVDKNMENRFFYSC